MRSISLKVAIAFLSLSASTANSQWHLEFISTGTPEPAGILYRGDRILRGSILSLDGGKTWKSNLAPAPTYVQDLVDNGTGVLFAPGVNVNIYHDSKGNRLGHAFTGRIHKTTDFGDTWTQVRFDSIFANDQPTKMYFWDDRNGYILQSPPLLSGPGMSYSTDALGSLMLTTDGGATWMGRAIDAGKGAAYNYRRGGMHDSLFGIFSSNVTRDGGVSWSRISGFQRVIDARFTSVVFAEGDDGELFTSADRGETWDSVGIFVTGDIQMTDARVGYVLGKYQIDTVENYRRFLTNDGGLTWEAMQGELDDLITSKLFYHFDRLDNSLKYGLAFDTVGERAYHQDSLIKFTLKSSVKEYKPVPLRIRITGKELRISDAQGKRFKIIDGLGRTVRDGVFTSDHISLHELVFGLYYVVLNETEAHSFILVPN